jgi:hypothetical protein
MSGAFIIPLVALAFPIGLLLFAFFFDAAFVIWAAYRTWREHGHWHFGALLHHR